MIPGIPRRPVPDWLVRLDPWSPFPLEEVLQGSLYYPSSGRDGDPIRYLGGFMHSFIYVDYGIARGEVLASLEDEHHRFRGYRKLFIQDLGVKDLTPQGWRQLPPREFDGRPPAGPPQGVAPFAIWTVFDREDGYGEEHGPERFSLVFLCGDGVASFQALYHGNRCRPEVVAIIQPGHGFGGNWTDFSVPGLIFSKSVQLNPAGRPDYLLYGGWARGFTEPCWPRYRDMVHRWRVAGGELTLWRESPEEAPAWEELGFGQ